MTLRISLIDDDSGYRDAIAGLLGSARDLQCVSTHPNGEHALRHLPAARPDVVLVDIKMPRLSGIETVRRLRGLRPGLLAVMLTGYGDDEFIFQALQAGAVGYLLKRSSFDTLLASVREVYAGGSPMTPEIARRVALHFRPEPGRTSAGHGLTPRELEVLQFVAQGRQSKEIAELLAIAQPTVHNHLRHIYEKLHVTSRTAAIARFFLSPPQNP